MAFVQSRLGMVGATQMSDVVIGCTGRCSAGWLAFELTAQSSTAAVHREKGIVLSLHYFASLEVLDVFAWSVHLFLFVVFRVWHVVCLQ